MFNRREVLSLVQLTGAFGFVTMRLGFAKLKSDTFVSFQRSKLPEAKARNR
jgi:hypothetical protein